MSSTERSNEAKTNSSRSGKTSQGAYSGAYSGNMIEEDGSLSKETAKLYKSFMQSYVTRINDASFRVPISGIRIGSAKYSRLAQINLKTRIITFSRFAIENVPERGRRYLVLHELAHVLEASHNKLFWQLVGKFEPEYKEIGLSLDSAFKQNVQLHEKTVRSLQRKARAQYAQPQDKSRPDMYRQNDADQQLQLFNNPHQTGKPSIIWTPDHGYVEPGSQRFGLHRDPKELFFKSGDHQAEETYAAYLDLQNDYAIEGGSNHFEGEDGELFEVELTTAAGEESQTNCIFDANSASDQAQDLYVYEDEGDFDQYYGTISGGDY